MSLTLHLLAQIPDAATDVLDKHGFAVWVSVALLVSFLGAMAAIGRWFFANQLQGLADIVRTVKGLELVTLQMQRQLLTHDLTVRGLNPSTGTDFDERDSRAAAVYKDLNVQLDQLQEAIKAQ